MATAERGAQRAVLEATMPRRSEMHGDWDDHKLALLTPSAAVVEPHQALAHGAPGAIRRPADVAAISDARPVVAADEPGAVAREVDSRRPHLKRRPLMLRQDRRKRCTNRRRTGKESKPESQHREPPRLRSKVSTSGASATPAKEEHQRPEHERN